MDKKEAGGGKGVSRKSTLGHVTKGRYHVNYPRGRMGSKLCKFWSKVVE